MKIINKYPLFLVLLPLFILLHIEKDYDQLLDYSSLYLEIFIICIAPFVIYGLAWMLYRSSGKTNLLAFAGVFLFYFLGDIKDALRTIFINGFFQSYTFLLPSALVLLIIVALLLRNTKKNFGRLFRFIHLALCLFILIDIIAILWPSHQKEEGGQEIKDNFSPCKDCPTPDIYYVILDEYTSSSFLQKEFGFDNSDIEKFLTTRGFQIIPGSKSNYNLTAFSMGSIFSMDYLTSIDTAKAYYLRSYHQGIQIVYGSPLFSLLEKQGYKIYNHSIFQVADYPSTIPSNDQWQTRLLYQQYNIFKKMDKDIGWQFPGWLRTLLGSTNSISAERAAHDSVALQQLFSVIKEKSPTPKFVYTHLLVPHDHPTLDSSGKRVFDKKITSLSETKTSYLYQLVNANKAIRKIVDSIQQLSATPPVIIIQGDHGFRSGIYSFKNDEFYNFNAFYFPDKNMPPLPDSLTSVNTFRIVFNRLFKKKYPMLENKNIFLKYKPL